MNTDTWKPSNSNDGLWSTSKNWTYGVPTFDSTVSFNSSINVTINSPAKSNSIIFLQPDTINITNSASLTTTCINPTVNNTNNYSIGTFNILTGGGLTSTGVINKVNINLTNGFINAAGLSNSNINGSGSIQAGAVTNTSFNSLNSKNSSQLSSSNTLKVSGTFYADDTFNINGYQSKLELDSSAIIPSVIYFNNSSNSLLKLDNPANFKGLIVGLGSTDSIDLVGLSQSNIKSIEFIEKQNLLQITLIKGSPITYSFNSGLNSVKPHFEDDKNGGTLITFVFDAPNWINKGGLEWNNLNGWTKNTIPTSNDNVIFGAYATSTIGTGDLATASSVTFLNGGSIFIGGGGSLTAGSLIGANGSNLSISTGGLLEVNSADHINFSINGGSAKVTAISNSLIQGYGAVIAGTVTNTTFSTTNYSKNGTPDSWNSLKVSGIFSPTDLFNLSPYSILEISSTSQFTSPINFFGNNNEVLKLDNPNLFAGLINGFGPNDTLDLVGVPFNGTSVSFSSNQNLLKVTQSSGVTLSFAFAKGLIGVIPQITSDGSNGVNINFSFNNPWIGLNGGDWNTPSNWSTKTLPNQNTALVFFNLGPVINNIAYASNIQFNGNASIIISPIGALNVGSIEGNVNSPNLIDINPGGLLNASGSVTFTTIHLGGGNLTLNSLQNSSVNGSGNISQGEFTDSSFQSISSGSSKNGGSSNQLSTLKVSGKFYSTDSFNIGSNSIVEISSSSIIPSPVSFNGTNNSILKLDNPNNFSGLISGFGPTNALDLASVPITSINTTNSTYSYAKNLLTVNENDGTTLNFSFAAGLYGAIANFSDDGHGGTFVKFTFQQPTWLGYPGNDWNNIINWATQSLPTSSTVVVLNNNIIRIGGKAYASNIQFNNNGNLMIDSGGSLNVGSIEGNSYIPSLHITSGGSIKSTGLINSVRLDISGGNIQVNAISNSSISGYGDISSGFYTNTQFSTIDNSNPIPTTSTNTVQKLKVSGTFFRNDAFTVSHQSILELSSTDPIPSVINLGTLNSTQLILDNPDLFNGIINLSDNNADNSSFIVLKGISFSKSQFDPTQELLTITKTDKKTLVLCFTSSKIFPYTVSSKNGDALIYFATHPSISTISKTISIGASSLISGVTITDSFALPTSNLTITLNDNNGLLNVTSTNGVIVTGGGKSPSNSLTLTGSLSSLNGILATLTDSNNKLGNDNITASVSDSLTGLSYTCQLSINVASPLSIKTDSNIIGQGITTKIKNILIASNANENTNIVLTVSDLKGLLSVTPTNLTMLPNTEVVKLMGALFGVEAGSATTNIVMIDVVKGGLVNAFSSYYTAAFGNTTTAAVASSILTNIGVIAGQNGLTVQQVTDQTAYLTGKINASPPSSRVETIMSYLELWSTVDSDPTFGAIYGAASKAWNAAISLAVQYASSGKQDLHFTVSNITSIPTPISVTPTTSIPISSINVNVVGNNSNTITLYGSLSGVNSTLATLTDTNTSLGPDNLNISVEDFTSGLVTTAIDLVTVKPQISISGTLAGQTNTDAPSNLPIKPFSKLIISDLDPSLIQTATITLSSPGNGVLSNLGNGSYDNARGIYTVSGLPSVVTSTIQKLTFIPTPHLVAPKSSFTTTFTVTDVDSIIQPKVNISDFAGSGVMGKTDGQSLSATFTEPIGLFVDHKGNVLIAGGGAIRQISPSGIVSTPTSKDFFSWPSAVTEDSSGNLYVTDSSVQTNPASIAIGPGGNQIYKVSPTGQITTFAGSTTHGNTNGNGANASFNSPTGIVMDAKGNLFVADNLNNEIRKITPSGDVTTFAGSGLRGNVDGVGSNASFYLPDQLAIDSSGNIYVGDNGNREIRKISPDGNVTTIARGLDDPRGVAVDSIGNVYFSEYSTNAIKKIDLSGIITTVASSPNVATLSNVSILDIKLPDQVAIDSYGNLLVANRGNNDILKISLNTTPIASDSKTSVITTVSISPITVSGVSSTPVTTTDAIKVSPFTNLTILDPNAAQTETVTITLSSSANGVLTNTGSGTFNGNTGVYSVSGTIDSVNKEIQELIFTPAPHQLSPGKTQTTTFTLKVVDTCGETFTVIPTKVNSTANTTVPIKSSGSFSGANGTTSFLIDSGNYSTTITGFKNGDSIKFNFLNAAVTLNNSSSTDGLLNITSTDPANHNQVIIHLTGISAPQDASISNLVNFNSAIGFGLGSLS